MNTRKRSRDLTAIHSIAISESSPEKMMKTNSLSGEANADVNNTNSDIDVPAVATEGLNHSSNVNSSRNSDSDDSTQPLFPDNSNDVAEILARADRVLAQIDFAPLDTQAPSVFEPITARQTQETATEQATNETAGAASNIEIKPTVPVAVPSTSGTSFRSVLDDSVIFIDGPSPLPRSVVRDEDVIFVDEFVPQHRITAIVDLCDVDDDQNKSKPATSTPQRFAPSARVPVINSPLSGSVVKCPVCLESVPNDEVTSTICGHLYCGPCIRNAIKSRKKCPLCNKNLNSKQIHRIYFQS